MFGRSTGWYFKTSGFVLRCYFTFIVIQIQSASDCLNQHFFFVFSRAPLCQRQCSLTVCLPLLLFRSNLTSCIVYRSVYIQKFSLWLPSIVQLHYAGYNNSLSHTFFGRPFQPQGGGRGGGNGVRGPKGFGFLSEKIWVLEPYNYPSLTAPSKAKTDLYLWCKWMTQRRELAEYSLPANSTISPLTTSPCSWSELGLYFRRFPP